MPVALPSLDLLRVFEACARLQGFTAAASELGSTQPAVSQQIQRLERQLQARLFERVYRGIELTEAGTTLLRHVQQAFEALHLGVQAVGAQEQREALTLATDFAFAAYWLMPRLSRFYQRNPQLDVSLVTSNRPMMTLPGEVDAAIVFGNGRLTQGEPQLLFPEEAFPVCSPALLASPQPLELRELARLPLLRLKASAGQQWFDWPGLFRAFGLPPPVSAPAASAPEAPAFDNYTLLMEAALAGRGVAIGWRHLVDDLLQRGLLRRVVRGSVGSPYGYHLVLPVRKRKARLSAVFADWVRWELAGDTGEVAPVIHNG